MLKVISPARSLTLSRSNTLESSLQIHVRGKSINSLVVNLQRIYQKLKLLVDLVAALHSVVNQR